MKNFDAIRLMYPDAAFSMNDDDISTVVWRTEGITTPTQAEIDAKIKQVEDEEAAKVVAKAAAKESAQAKLAAIGLTPEEISALSNN
jgi:hypothetical protein